LKRLKKVWITFGSAVLFLAGKMKWLLAVLKFLKLSSLISLFISLGVYALAYGWKFAIALVYLIYVHEMGHLFAAKKKGIPTTKAVFLPFVGAFIALKEEPKTAKDEAYLAYAGPLWGTLAFLPALPLYWMTKEPFWGLVITLGAMINLFNLMPIHPLDGGRIVGVISPKIWLIGLIGMCAYFLWRPRAILLLILFFGIAKWWETIRKEFRHQKMQIENEIYEQSLEELKRYMSLSEMEQLDVRNQWEEETKHAESVLKRLKKWYVPILQDEKKFTKYRWTFYAASRQKLLAATRFDETREEAIKDLMNDLKEAMSENHEMMQRQKVYYASDWKTKWLWLFLYLALALVLTAFTVYGQKVLVKHQDLLS
jgi:Zn-dependent protease